MNINFTLFAQASASSRRSSGSRSGSSGRTLLAAIEERQKTIADGLAAADKGARSLEEAKGQIQAMVEEARGQARGILDQAQTRANGIVDEARVTADQERERIIQSAKADVDQQINKARDELRGQVAAIAVAGAEKILAREIDPRTHQDLLDQARGADLGHPWLSTAPSHDPTPRRSSNWRMPPENCRRWSEFLKLAAVLVSEPDVNRMLFTPGADLNAARRDHCRTLPRATRQSGAAARWRALHRRQLPEGAGGEPAAQRAAGHRRALRSPEGGSGEHAGRDADQRLRRQRTSSGPRSWTH